MTASRSIDQIRNHILASVASPTSCLPSTEHLLDCLFNGEAIDAPTGKIPRRDKTDNKSSALQAPVKKQASCRAPRSNDIKLVKDQRHTVSEKELIHIAEDVVNDILKALGRSKGLTTQSTTDSERRAPRATHKAGCAHAKSSKSIREIPLNRAPHADASKKPLPKPPTKSAVCHITRDDGIKSLATCGLLAFNFLQSKNMSRIEPNECACLDVENGIVAFIDKLISIGQMDLAIPAIESLKKTLDVRIPKSGKSTATSTRSKESQPKDRDLDLSIDILDFEGQTSNKSVIPFIISFQLIVLKAVVALPKRAVMDSLRKYLRLESSSSVFNLISDLARISGNMERAALQFEQLSRTIFSLCPKLTSANDKEAVNSIKFPSPDECMWLQCFAFRCRLNWMTLAEHRGDFESELSKPFVKCTVAYSRRSTAKNVESYSVLKACYELLQGTVQDNYSSRGKSLSHGILDVMTDFLISQTPDSGLKGQEKPSKAFQFPDNLELTDSLCTQCTKACTVATESVRQCLSNNSEVDVTLILEILSMLPNLPIDTEQDLDNLITALIRLRNSTTHLARLQMNKQQNQSFRQSAALNAYRSLAFTCVRVLLEFKKKDRTTPQRTQNIGSAVEPSVECALWYYSIFKTWSKTEEDDISREALENCASLLQESRIDLLANSHSEHIEKSKSPALTVRLSHALYELYLRTTKQSIEKSRSTLEKACQVLEEESASNKVKGNLILKLDNLAKLNRRIGLFDMARAEFSSLIGTACQIRVLDQPLHASDKSLNFYFEYNSHTKLFGDAIELLLELEARSPSNRSRGSVFWDDTELDIQQRGLILEWQLQILEGWNNSKTLRHQAVLFSSTLANTLFTLYDGKEWDVQRLRVSLQILSMSIDCPSAFNDTVLRLAENCALEFVTHTGNEETSPLAQHLRSSLEVVLSLRNHDLIKDGLENVTDGWSALLDICETFDDFRSVIGRTTPWFQQLEYLFDFLGAKGRSQLQLSVLRIILRAWQLQGETASEEIMRWSFTIGQHLLRLGYSEQGGLFLAKGKDRYDEQRICLETRIEYQQSHAEYFLELGEYSQCHHHLDQALTLASIEGPAANPHRLLNANSKVSELCRSADSLHLESRLSFATGNYLAAFLSGVREFTLVQSAWKSLENRGPPLKIASLTSEDPADSVVSGLAEMTISASPEISSVFDAPPNVEGPRFWLLLPRLCRAAINLSELSYHGGSFQDATYFLDQALKVAERARSNHFIASILLKKGEFDCRRGELDCAWKHLSRAVQIQSEAEPAKELFLMHLTIGHYYHSKGDCDCELNEYEKAESVLQELMQTNHIDKLAIGSAGKEVFTKHVDTKLSPKKRTNKRQHRLKTTSKADEDDHAAEVPVIGSQGSLAGSCLLAGLKQRLNYLKIRCKTQNGDHAFLKNETLPNSSDSISTNSSVDYQILRARLLFREASGILSANSILSMLTESAVSFPAASKPSGHIESGYSEKLGRSDLAKISSRPTKLLENSSSCSDAIQDFAGLLQQVIRLLSTNSFVNDNKTAVWTVRQKGSLLGTASLLFSAVHNIMFKSFVNPAAVLLLTDSPQSLSSVRDQAITKVDWIQKDTNLRNLPVNGLSPVKWALSYDYSHFQNEFVNSLPSTWKVLTFSLDTEKTHLHIAKYQTGDRPFTLRLPLSREIAEDLSEDEFTFEQAKSELADIVGLSDATVHAAREDPDVFRKKGAKSQWWSERENLNERLKDLLSNIENMWLGGFRGIFSHFTESAELLQRFEHSFETILDKYLPSRRTTKARSNTTRIKLEKHTFDLFLGLAHSVVDLEELGEDMIDLLYFVIDVLQFNGEANAYDEIDFDSMIVEIQDALECYKEAHLTSEQTKAALHTILVLDKELHVFPWESLPCLDGHSISRAYSIVEIYERIKLISHQTQSSAENSGLKVSRHHGTYILNPSKDLDKTENRFKNDLHRLSDDSSGWKSVIGRAPTESEFVSALYTPAFEPGTTVGENAKDGGENSRRILLYFGHGSGTQYIRHRRIKQLRYDHQASSKISVASAKIENHFEVRHNSPIEVNLDANEKSFSGTTDQKISTHGVESPNPDVSVALLFGCSSASLSENGEFEPHGTPRSYMLAGAPALLGSLWDVTDGDVDKFAGGVLERWGLFERGTFEDLRVTSNKARGKGKSKKNWAESNYDPDDAPSLGPLPALSLTEAVAQSRKDCYLKYLNGAAMVVYGVPTYLESR